MNLGTFVIVLTAVIFSAAAQLLLKAGARVIGVIDSDLALLPKLVAALFQPSISAGLVCCVISVGMWIVALSRVEVSIAYPMLSIGYVVNAFAAWWLFSEALTPMRLTGIGVILAGVVILARS